MHPVPRVDENTGLGMSDYLLGQLHFYPVNLVEENACVVQSDDQLSVFLTLYIICRF